MFGPGHSSASSPEPAGVYFLCSASDAVARSPLRGGPGSKVASNPMTSLELLVPVLLMLVSMGTIVLAVVRTRR